MSREHRRHDRYRVRIDAELVVGKVRQPAQITDVSFGGLATRTYPPPPLRQLMKLNVDLPGHGPTELLAMAVFQEPAGPPRALVGQGLQLFGVSPEIRERWEHFVKGIRTGPELASGVDPSDPILPELRVRFSGPEALDDLLDRSYARGRIYVRTPVFLEPGTAVMVALVHPRSEQEHTLPAVVQSVIRRPDFEGLRVSLPRLDTPGQEALGRFVGRAPHITIDLDGGDIDDGEIDESEMEEPGPTLA